MDVALTFDAEHPDRPGSAPGVARGVLDALERAGVAATFFLQGRWAQAHPDLAAAIARSGHLVGSHSHYHARMTLLSDEGLRRDIGDAGSAIRDAAGLDPRPWFRCPWGDGGRDERVSAALEEAGYRHVGWDVVAEDWEPGRGADVIEEWVVRSSLDRERAVVLFHTWPASSAESVPRVIRRLADAGARFVTVGEIPPEHLDRTRDPQHAVSEGS